MKISKERNNLSIFTFHCPVFPHPSALIPHPPSLMSSISDSIQAKCLAFGDRIIKLNDYLLEQASRRYDVRKGKSAFSHQTSDISQPSSFSRQPSRVPVHLQSVAALCNQLLRSGTSIGANNAEASSAISKADFKSKSYIALKEARECLYWLELLHRNNYLTDEQYGSIYADAEELVKILVARCKKLDAELNKE
jgi:four helix bundle protein